MIKSRIIFLWKQRESSNLQRSNQEYLDSTHESCCRASCAGLPFLVASVSLKLSFVFCTKKKQLDKSLRRLKFDCSSLFLAQLEFARVFFPFKMANQFCCFIYLFFAFPPVVAKHCESLFTPSVFPCCRPAARPQTQTPRGPRPKESPAPTQQVPFPLVSLLRRRFSAASINQRRRPLHCRP